MIKKWWLEKQVTIHSFIKHLIYLCCIQRNYGLSLNVTNGWKIGSQLWKREWKNKKCLFKKVLPSQCAFSDSRHPKTNNSELAFSFCPTLTSTCWLIPDSPAPWSSLQEPPPPELPSEHVFYRNNSQTPLGSARPQSFAGLELPCYPAFPHTLRFPPDAQQWARQHLPLTSWLQANVSPDFLPLRFFKPFYWFTISYFLHHVSVMLTKSWHVAKHFSSSHKMGDISIVQIRKLKPERSSNLYRDTQLESQGKRIHTQKFGCRAFLSSSLTQTGWNMDPDRWLLLWNLISLFHTSKWTDSAFSWASFQLPKVTSNLFFPFKETFSAFFFITPLSSLYSFAISSA